MATPEKVEDFRVGKFLFKLSITSSFEPARNQYNVTYLIGNTKKPCLKFSYHTPPIEVPRNNRFLIDSSIGNLQNIESNYECIENKDSVPVEDIDDVSFGKQILTAFILYIKERIPTIKRIKLNDKSIIECNQAAKDTLDLPTYYIALYGKTWYEHNFQARLVLKHDEYRAKVNTYMTPEFKDTISWDTMKGYMLLDKESAVYSILMSNEHIIKEMYSKAPTLPSFFTTLKSTISKQYLCQFFKNWLKSFIYDNVWNIGNNTGFIIQILHEGGRHAFNKNSKTPASLKRNKKYKKTHRRRHGTRKVYTCGKRYKR